MKKLLVVFLSAVMVLSFAAVSMAAVNVSADWRAEWQILENDTKTTPSYDDLGFGMYDLRFNFDGKVSDSIDAHLQMTYSGNAAAVKEYWATFKQSWGTIQAGTWDYKLIPSRVIIKPHGINCVNEKTMQIVTTIPVGDFSIGALVIPDTRAGMNMDWDLKFGYKADAWGAEVHYGYDDSKLSAKNNYYSADFYYQITKDLKVFAFAIDTEGALSPKSWNDELAPVIGAQWKNIAGSKLTASLEFGLEEAGAAGKEFTPWASQLKYSFNNKLALEIEYYNHQDTVENDKLIIRPRIAF
jgi:hypothetical protein